MIKPWCGSVLIAKIVGASLSPSGPAATTSIQHSGTISAKTPFALSVTITNQGSDPIVYKHHWSWTSGTMYLEAAGPDGQVVKSDPVVFDIPAADECLSFKPLDRGEAFSFTPKVNGEYLRLKLTKPGTYLLTWRYECCSSPSECRVSGISQWIGKLASQPVRLEVRP